MHSVTFNNELLSLQHFDAWIAEITTGRRKTAFKRIYWSECFGHWFCEGMPIYKDLRLLSWTLGTGLK